MVVYHRMLVPRDTNNPIWFLGPVYPRWMLLLLRLKEGE